MGDETQKMERTNPMRLWLERHLGKVILTSIPVIMLSLAGWIYTIGNEIAVIKEKMKADEAQWNALLTTNERLRTLEIETKVNQKLLYLLTEKELPPESLHMDRMLGERPDPDKVDDEAIPHEERLREFKLEQMEQIQQRIERK